MSTRTTPPEALPEVEALTAAVATLVEVNSPPSCASDPEAWFSDDPAKVAQAVELCTRCPIRSACYAAAQAVGERHGVWGAVDWTARHKSATKRKRTA